MKKKIVSAITGLTFRMVFGVMLLLFMLNVATSIIGYLNFTNAFVKEYTASAYHTAETAEILVDGDKIDEYLNTSGLGSDYEDKLIRMNNLCKSQHLNAVYVIKPDTADYSQYISVFNAVNESSGYTPWEVGEIIQTEGDEYRDIYRGIYENGVEKSHIVSSTGVMGSKPFVTAFVPVKDSSGEVSAVLCVQRPMNELVTVRRTYLLNIGISVLIITAFAAFVLTAFLKRQYVEPTQKIIVEAKRFSKENSYGDFSKLENKSTEHGIREIREMVDAIKKMEKDTLHFIDDLKCVTANQERISTELSLATSIQSNMLPSLFPPFPNRKEFDIYATMTPAKEVGGDFYDFFLIDNDHLGIVMADVSGKGIPAALFMMATKILIKSNALGGGTPSEVLKSVNSEICKTNADDMFVTIWFGILTISTGEVIASNAGHEYPAIKQSGGKYELFKDKHGLVLGGFEGSKYQDYTFSLGAGDSLFLYTDGVPEATNKDGKMFGNERMLETLNSNSDASVYEALESMSTAINSFVADAEQFDDITMLCLKMISEDNEKSITVCPNPESLQTLSDFLDETALAWEIPSKTATKLQIVLDEVFSNIIHYSNATKSVIKLQRKDGFVQLVFADNGVPYDPTTAPEPDITSSADEREVGGLGIFMVKKIMDEVVYKFEDGNNILILKKNL